MYYHFSFQLKLLILNNNYATQAYILISFYIYLFLLHSWLSSTFITINKVDI